MNNKLPLLVIASPRTGSSAVLEYFSKLHGIKHIFNEPDGRNEMKEFLDYALDNNNYSLKIQARHLHFYDSRIAEVITKSKDAFRIRIRRKDLVHQTASFYVSKTLNKWFYYTHENTESYSMIIDEAKIKNCADIIKRFNNDVAHFPVEFDLDLYYEDLPIMPDNCYIKTPLPNNYDQIIDIIVKNNYAQV